MKAYRSSLLVMALACCKPLLAEGVTSFDDIEFWTGQGANRAATAIDWDAGNSTDHALVWGFRWDGEATGETMLRAVLAADDRLFAKLSSRGQFGVSVYALGYDANDNGEFGVTDGTEFDEDGVAVTGLPNEDEFATDSGDLYREGWFTGAWSYGTKDSNPWLAGDWNQSRVGMSFRTLANGSWDSWAFTSPIVLEAFAENPVAAAPPGAAADFDGDLDVDGTDFLAWQRGFGLTASASLADGDANGDAAVDAMDLLSWAGSFGGDDEGSFARTTSQAVPEPAAVVTAALVIFLVIGRASLQRRKIS